MCSCAQVYIAVEETSIDIAAMQLTENPFIPTGMR